MKIAIIAGEASGDILASGLMRGLKRYDFEGIGGTEMEKLGLSSLFPMQELSVMGISDVLPRALPLLRRVKQTADYIIEGEFDAVITVDSPDFCMRVLKKVKVKKPNIPCIHYVAPSVWAWRAGRAKKMAKYVDHVLCLLPFEPPLMREVGMSADFVGHPVAKREAPKRKELKAFRDEYGEFIALFPGSRRSEIKRHCETYANTLSLYCGQERVLVPVHAHLEDEVRTAFAKNKNVTVMGADDNFEATKNLIMHGAEFAVATSGTVSFELAWSGTATIVGYRSGWLTKQIYKAMAKIKYASLANIILNSEVIPEFLFEKFNAANLANAMTVLSSSENERVAQKIAFKKMRGRLIPDIDVVDSVQNFLENYRN